MVLGILATMTIVATAFLVFMRQSYRAATNTQFSARAELACRSGLEHAIRAISFALDGYTVTPDGALDSQGEFFDDPTGTAPNGSPVGAGAGWYKYFEGNGGNTEEIVRYTDTHVITGRRFRVGIPTVQMEYAVRVYDLDGRLHANLSQWTDAVAASADLPGLLKVVAARAGLSDEESDLVKAQAGGVPYSSPGEVPRRAGIIDTADKYSLQESFTVCPFIRSDRQDSSTYADPETTVSLRRGGLAPGVLRAGRAVFSPSNDEYGILDNTEDSLVVDGDCTGEDGNELTIYPPRPGVNINTVQQQLLFELLDEVPSINNIGNLCDGMARYVMDTRPFAGRHEYEEALRRAAGDDAIVDIKATYGLPESFPQTSLTERQFNDLLNSTAGILNEDGSTYDEPGNPGVYTFNGWKDADEATWEGPTQTGGHRTDPAGNDVTGPSAGAADNVTWSTEFKFTSRFFHIYVLGRGINPDTGRPRGVRRLHAIYDAEADRILWLRWNISGRGSVVDIQ
jgi:hypothetical protein